jgi:acetyltransferase-like isoleucine patch superfamily enzyme
MQYTTREMSGWNSALTWLLLRVGKQYRPDPDLPAGLIVGILFQRAAALARGLIRLRARVFVGPGVRLRGKRTLHVEPYATLDRGCQIDGHSRDGVYIGARTKIGAHSVVACTGQLSKLGRGLRIGRDCGIGEFGYFGAAGGITIGDDVIMGQYVSFHSESHRHDDPERPIRLQGVRSEGIVIEDDVWVGAKATFLDGCVVGRHSIVAAGAVVRGTFPGHTVIGGVPARVLKSLRDDADTARAREELFAERGRG